MSPSLGIRQFSLFPRSRQLSDAATYNYNLHMHNLQILSIILTNTNMSLVMSW